MPIYRWPTVVAVLFMSGCAAGPASHLIPPLGATSDSIAKDVRDCLDAARTDVVSHSEPLSETEKSGLRCHLTKGFIREGHPCVQHHGDLLIPCASTSLAVNIPDWLYPIVYPSVTPWYGPVEVTDRYVLGLLGRGYHWPEDYRGALNDGAQPTVPTTSLANQEEMAKPPLGVRVCHLALTPWQMMYRTWDQMDQPGPHRSCNTAGKYFLAPFVLASTPIYLTGYYLPGGRLWDWQRVERDRISLEMPRSEESLVR